MGWKLDDNRDQRLIRTKARMESGMETGLNQVFTVMEDGIVLG